MRTRSREAAFSAAASSGCSVQRLRRCCGKRRRGSARRERLRETQRTGTEPAQPIAKMWASYRSLHGRYLDAGATPVHLVDASAEAFGAGMPDRDFDVVVSGLPETAALKDARLRLRTRIRAELDPAGSRA